jgi:hypothetical protein
MDAVAASHPDAAKKSASDPRLSRSQCEVMGRVFVRGRGCSRTACEAPAVLAKAAVNTEMCRLRGQGDFAFGAAIDYRRCVALHRRWVAPVNWCAANPDRGRRLVERAPQCVAPHSTYVNHQETEGYYDECLRPSRVRELRRIARNEQITLSRVASMRSETLCAFRPQHEFRKGRCVDVQRPTGPQGGVLLLGDSIAYRGINELAPVEPGLILDGHPGRRLTDLEDRLERFRSARGQPDGLILELGANAARPFAEADLRRVLGLLPPPTPVMLVLPFRSNPETRAVSRFTKRYGRWMRHVANTRDGTCIADWPSFVGRYPRVLVDGVHLTPRGEARWADWITREWRGCQGRLDAGAS